MRILISAFLFLSLLCGLRYSKTHAAAATNTGYGKTDTTFILREFDTSAHNYISYHAVYIEKNRDSRFYKRRLDFKMHADDSSLYVDNLLDLKAHFKLFRKHRAEGLPTQWLPLNLYKGKYYIYFPSEWGEEDSKLLTDSTLVEATIEGPWPQAILSLNKLSKSTWFLKTYSPDWSDHKIRRVTIHIVNPQNKMAVWEYMDETGINRYELCIPSAYADHYDMVVNYCMQNRTAEFMFDRIDYKRLLKHR